MARGAASRLPRLVDGPLSARGRRSNVSELARFNGGKWPQKETARAVGGSGTTLKVRQRPVTRLYVGE
jgi:hypothetical protein